MVSIKKGQQFPSEMLKSGKKKDGSSWVMVKAKAEQGYDAIDIFAANAEKIDVSLPVEIKDIVEVKKTARKYEKDGEEKWADVYAVNAVLENVGTLEGFSAVEEDIPF